MVAMTAATAEQRILVVEDEPSISDVVATALRYQEYSVTQSEDGRDGFDLASVEDFDLIVLDVMLPRLDGYEICSRLRDAGRFVPVIFLTARDESEDRIRGFVNGGDDYLTKPFSVDELLLRVAAILRRSTVGVSTEVIRVADLHLEPAGREVRRGSRRVELSPTEFSLLHYLMVNTGTVVSKAQILADVWDYDFTGDENVVEVYIGYLRRKIDHGRPPLIHTVRGAGYVVRTN